MKKTRFTDEQMVTILREADGGPVPEVAKRHGVSAQTIYSWRKHFGTLEPVDVKRLRQLEQRNGRLKKMVADRNSSSTCSRRSRETNGRRTCARAGAMARAPWSGARPRCRGGGATCSPSVGPAGGGKPTVGSAAARPRNRHQRRARPPSISGVKKGARSPGPPTGLRRSATTRDSHEASRAPRIPTRHN